MLRHVPLADDGRILVGTATRDDAAVFRLTENRAVVATVDFFTPIVDDAYAFGAIAAANAFSDIYAMGATPLFALNPERRPVIAKAEMEANGRRVLQSANPARQPVIAAPQDVGEFRARKAAVVAGELAADYHSEARYPTEGSVKSRP